MPLTAKGTKVMSALKSEYGAEKGESVFYAMKNKGTLSRVDDACASYLDACRRGDAFGIKHCSERMMRGRVVR